MADVEEKILYLDNYSGSEYDNGLYDDPTGHNLGNWTKEGMYFINMSSTESFILTKVKFYTKEVRDEGEVPSRDIIVQVYEVEGDVGGITITKFLGSRAITLTSQADETQHEADISELKITLEKGKKYILGISSEYQWAAGNNYYGYQTYSFYEGEDEGLNDRSVNAMNVGNFKEYFQGKETNRDTKLVVGSSFNFEVDLTYNDPKLAGAKIQLRGYRWDVDFADYNRIINLAGAGATAEAKTIPNVKGFVINAMAQVIAWTKYNFIDNWESLPEVGKDVIRSLVEYLSAKAVATYNYADYNSRFEAREIAEDLQYQADRLLSLLSENTGLLEFLKKGD